jgi:hypothetical protein
MDKPILLRNRVRSAALIWNAVALLAFAIGMAYVVLVASLGAPSRVTTLDRAGVINEAELHASYPQLAANLRGDLGRWIAQEERETACLATKVGMGVAAVNLLLILVFWHAPGNPSNRTTGAP